MSFRVAGDFRRSYVQCDLLAMSLLFSSPVSVCCVLVCASFETYTLRGGNGRQASNQPLRTHCFAAGRNKQEQIREKQAQQEERNQIKKNRNQKRAIEHTLSNQAIHYYDTCLQHPLLVLLEQQDKLICNRNIM